MKKKNIILISSLCILTCLLVIGFSYAYWRFSYLQDKTNNATSGCFSLELTNEQNEINLTNAYPITDEQGKKLKPFSFTLKNNCTIFASYQVNLEMLTGTDLKSDYVAVLVDNNEIALLSSYPTTTTVIDGSVEARTIATGTLSSGDEVDYNVAFWMDEDVTLENTDSMNKTFKSKIVIVSEPSDYTPVKAGYTKLKDAILANEYQTTPQKAIEKINAKQEVDLNNSAPTFTWVETIGDSTTRTIAKPAPSAINSDDQTSDLTANDTLIKLYKTKTFNSDTGSYTLADPIIVDPTTVDFNETTNGGIKYYYSWESISYNNSTEKLYTWNSTSDTTIYEVTGATKNSNTTTTWNGISYSSITYTLNVTLLRSKESESDKSDKGLYAAPDRNGTTTYYYRGNVKNNNVLFANLYWQIVRINGDGSVRLMYNGKTPNATGINQSINAQNYQFNSNYNNPAYVGYMYGNTIGTRENNIKNEVNSTIKTAVDSWYDTNILDKEYSRYIADSGFCNDRSLFYGDGAQTDRQTRYSAWDRWDRKTAIFTCPNEASDLFTLTTSTYGNKALTYPVGLITYDELVFAGMDYYHLNKMAWVYSAKHYWTISPAYFDTTLGSAIGWIQENTGYLSPWAGVHGNWGVRPVISLKADVEITEGIGTINAPFKVKEN